MLLASGWQADLFSLESLLVNGVPWICVVGYSAWWWLLTEGGLYRSIDGWVRERYGDLAAGPASAWVLHMLVYHAFSLMHCFFDNVQGPWTKAKAHR